MTDNCDTLSVSVSRAFGFELYKLIACVCFGRYLRAPPLDHLSETAVFLGDGYDE
jgi:hypothetical protein